MNSETPEPVAIVGMSALFAGSHDLAGFFRDVLTAQDRIGDVPATHWLADDYYDPDPSVPDKTYCRRGGFLTKIAFDPLKFGILPNALPATDTAQLLALIAAERVLADAARTRTTALNPDRISVVLGVASTTELVVSMSSRLQAPVWRKALREAGLPESEVSDICQRIAAHYTPWQENTFPGLLGNVVAGRIANRLNLGGMNCVIDAACASSLAAVSLAMKELAIGDSDLVVAGGVDALNDIMMYMCFSKTPAFSPTGDCRPFSDAADGTIIGEGVGLLALRRLRDAERDGDAIYAVIRGLGASSDGRVGAVYAPSAEGQAKALARAYARAGYSPSTVELVEAHGTGTHAGDAAEFRGLVSVFGPAAAGRRGFCALGSVKSQIGHTKAAAGAAGLIKTALALHSKVLPPTLKVERPNPALGIDESPFYLNTATRPWIRSRHHPRRASVSSFGFGGSNFHVALEEYAGQGKLAPRVRALSEELVLCSAPSRDALVAELESLAGAGESLARAAFRTARQFDAHASARVALVAADEAELALRARRAAHAIVAGREAELGDADTHFGFGAPLSGDLAYLFPGQGSQYLGMGSALAAAFDAARAPWDSAVELELFDETPLHELAFPRAVFNDAARAVQEQRLTEMANAQPAIAAVSLGLLQVLELLGFAPAALAGHSFGEVVALCAAGAIARSDVLSVARRRGELMMNAARHCEGAMLACAADGTKIERVLSQAGQVLSVANDNAPNQVVLSGTIAAIAEAEVTLKAAGMTAIRLPVATAFHSAIVAPSARPFHEYLSTLSLSSPRVPVYGNTTALRYPSSAPEIAAQLARQLAEPVCFRAMIERMYADGSRCFVEVGPGRVLSGLVSQCLGSRPHLVVCLDDRKAPGLRGFFRGLGRLAVSGRPLNLAALFRDYAEPAAPESLPAHAVMISGANLNKPYPPADGAAGLPPPNPERVREPTRPEPAHFERAHFEPEPHGVVMPSTSASPPLDDSSAFERIQHETFEAHRQYQELMAESHRAFLAVAAQALGEAGGVGAVRPLPSAVIAAPSPPAAKPLEPPHAPPPIVALAPPAVPPAPLVSRAPVAAAPSTPAPAPAALDLSQVVLEVVAAKTGYPSEMLNLDLQIEAGLGIDSIKQVEILSELGSRLPGLPEIKQAELARFKTLRDIVTRLSESSASSAAGGTNPSVSAPAPREVSQPALAELDLSAPRLVSAPAARLELVARRAGEIVYLTNEAPDLAREIAERLRARGVLAEVVARVPDGASAAISLAALAPANSAASALSVHLSVFAVARTVAGHQNVEQRLFVALQAAGGFGLAADPGPAAWFAGVPGIVKTAAREWPGAALKAIDLSAALSASRAAELVVEELVSGGPELEIAFLADGERCTVLSQAEPEPRSAPVPAEQRLEAGSVLLVSGGARGVTARSVEALAAANGLRLVLLGRTQLLPTEGELATSVDPIRLTRLLARSSEAHAEVADLTSLRAQARALAAANEVRATLERLAARGIDAQYLAVDVRDEAALGAALARVRAEWGPIAGVVHGAGVLADKRIAELSDADFQLVFSTKVLGLSALLGATRSDPLRLVALFSSVAARAGNSGQAAYAAANEVLNKVAHGAARERAGSALVRAYNFGPWAGGMVDAGLQAHFERQGVELIPELAGAKFFADDAQRTGPVELVVQASAPSTLPEFTLRLHIDPARDRELLDHQIRGRVVVPLAFMIERLLATARGVRPRAELSAVLHDVCVLSGVTLAPGEARRMTVRGAPQVGSPEQLELTVSDESGRACYRARAEFTSQAAVLPPTPTELGPWTMTAERAYESPLFHGPRFHALDTLEGVSMAGGLARLRGAAQLGWPDVRRALDPALIDGGLQLGVLWAAELHGMVAMPQRVGTVRVARSPEPGEAVRCAFAARPQGSARVDYDFVYSTLDGEILAVLSDAEFYGYGP